MEAKISILVALENVALHSREYMKRENSEKVTGLRIALYSQNLVQVF